VIRLDLNESPKPPPPEVLEAARRALAEANRYPEKSLIRSVEEALAEYVGVPARHVAVTCGGDAALLALFLVSKAAGRAVAFPRYSFSMYRELAEASGSRVIVVPMAERGDAWELDYGVLLEAAREAAIVLVDNPNNPTGSLLLDPGRVEELASEARGLVVVDEAYYEFSRVTAAGLVESHDNLVVLRTLSKAFSLAGLRVGYVVAGGSVAGAIRRLLPFPTSRPSLAAALAALEARRYVERIVEDIVEEREWLRSRLEGVARKVYRSHANFLLVDTGFEDAARRLAENGVAVRATAISSRHVRVTVAGRRESEALIDALSRLAGGVRPGGGSSQPPG
jgi:histidinol-phosphate aminotransferase